MADISIIVAVDEHGGIGKWNMIPWYIPEDLRHFKKTTTGNGNNAVIMGRKTWLSIPEHERPLKNRLNIVLSQNENFKINDENTESLFVCNNLKDALKKCKKVDEIFIIGGSSIYKEVLEKNLCDKIYLTSVEGHYGCDVNFPVSLEYIQKHFSQDQFRFSRNPSFEPTFVPNKFIADLHERNGNREELEYLNIAADIIQSGTLKENRTGIDTLSLFGRTMRFSLRDSTIPLLTTKRVFWRGLAEELLWFISGSTNAKELSDKGVRIWDGNGSKDFLEKRGLGHRVEGDLGPVYGFQWRHFGAEYTDTNDDYSNKGVDQLKDLIETIKNDPNSRRMIISAWNPVDLPEMALPPCHLMMQFYVSNGELSCQMYQRSCDIGLGVPFNIASYSLLTHMLAHCTGLKAGEFIHVLGDAHVYVNHIEPLKEQVMRNPRPFPYS